MTQQNLDFAELQELKNQFNLLDMKLEKQRIINEEMIQESMKEKLSYIEKWYRNRFYTCVVAAPIVSIIFIVRNITEGVGDWTFGFMILLVALVELYFDRKAYRVLDIKNLPNLNMTQATENVIKHKQLRSLANKVLLLPFIVVIVWTILVAGGYTWNLKIISVTVFMMGLSFSYGFQQMKKNQKRLESVLEQIKKLRE
jgi:L-asparagine transporter-like permease